MKVTVVPIFQLCLVEKFRFCSPMNQSVLLTKDAPDLALGAANDLGLTDVRDDLF